MLNAVGTEGTNAVRGPQLYSQYFSLQMVHGNQEPLFPPLPNLKETAIFFLKSGITLYIMYCRPDDFSEVVSITGKATTKQRPLGSKQSTRSMS